MWRIHPAPAAAALTALGLAILWLCPTAHWLDSQEFVAIAQTLAPSHPPGSPLVPLTDRLVSLAPIGEIAFRVNLASALAIGLCVLLAYALTRRLVAHIAAEPETPWLAAAVALLFGLSRGAQINAVRAEVYALATLLCLAVLVAILDAAHAHRERRRGEAVRQLLLAALSFGLAFAVHPLMAVSLFPGILALLLVTMPRVAMSPRVLALCALLFCVGLSLYLLLPIRTGAGVLAWGAPDTIDRFLHVFFARDFSRNIGHASQSSLLESMARTLGILLDDLGSPALLLAIFGIFALLRRSPPTAMLVVLCAIGNFFTVAIQPTVDRANPDAHGYLLPCVALLAACVGVAIRAIEEWVASATDLVRGIGAACAVALAVAAGIRAEPHVRMTETFFGREIIARGLAILPQNATLLVSDYKTHFAWMYEQAVERARPDLDVAYRGFLNSQWYRRRLTPRILSLLGPGRDDAAKLIAGAAAGPLFIEQGLAIPAQLASALRPAGLFLRVDPQRSPADAESHRIDSAFWERLSATRIRRDLETARFVLWAHLTRALLAEARGDRDDAESHARAALQLAPGDPELIDIARRVATH